MFRHTLRLEISFFRGAAGFAVRSPSLVHSQTATHLARRLVALGSLLFGNGGDGGSGGNGGKSGLIIGNGGAGGPGGRDR